MNNENPSSSPSLRLLLLWLTLIPLTMLAAAAVFAFIAARDERWGLLAVMAVLALLAGVLFVAQRRFINSYLAKWERK